MSDPQTSPQPASPAYEFSDAENKTFSLLSRALLAAAAIMGTLSLIKLAFAALNYRDSGSLTLPALDALDGLILAAVSTIALKTQRSVHQVISTQGDDIGHLMTGIKSLRTYFAVQAAGILLLIAGTFASLLAPSPLSDDEPPADSPTEPETTP